MRRKITFPTRTAPRPPLSRHSWCAPPDADAGAVPAFSVFGFQDDPVLQTGAAAAVGRGPRTGAATGRMSRSDGRAATRYTRLNDRLGLFVALSVPLAAVPLALNRPTLWLGWGVIMMFAALVYLDRARRIDPARPALTLSLPWWAGTGLVALALCIPGFALIQALPLGRASATLAAALAWPEAGGVDPAMPDPAHISLLPGASALAALRVCFYIVFAFLALEIAGSRQRATQVGWWVFWGVVAHAAWALVALNGLGDAGLWGAKTAYEGAATGTFINRNGFATFLAMGACLGLALILEQGGALRPRRGDPMDTINLRRLDRLPGIVGLATILLALVATQSRMGVLVGITGLVICSAVMTVKRTGRRTRPLVILSAVVLAGGGGALIMAGDGVIDRLVLVERAFETRFQGYAYALDLIRDRPLLGYGLDAFRPAFETVHRPPLPVSAIWDRGHSTYLSYWVETGLLVGSIPIVLGVLVAVRLATLLHRRTADVALPAAALAVLCLGALHSLVDFSLEMPANVILLITILALGVAPRMTGGAQRTDRRPSNLRARR
jgi:O-antigen ligase